MCEVLGVSTSGYYEWRSRPPSEREMVDRDLLERIRSIWKRSQQTYGAPRVYGELRKQGVHSGRKRVARLMRLEGLQGAHRRRRSWTTHQDRRAKVAPDLVHREFKARAPNRLWLADMTEIKTAEGTLYLAAILDVFSRRAVGWAMDTHKRAELVLAALEMAIQRRRPQMGTIHHSDRGSQYTSVVFGQRLVDAGLAPSMGSVGDAYDNAMMESFFATVECELIKNKNREKKFDVLSFSEARSEVFYFIEGFYNTRRSHSSLGNVSPVEFERRWEQEERDVRLTPISEVLGPVARSVERRYRRRGPRR